MRELTDFGGLAPGLARSWVNLGDKTNTTLVTCDCLLLRHPNNNAAC